MSRPAPMLAEGTRIGSYRIGRLLGRGGMGEVYDAIHVGLDKRVALKTLSSALSNDETAVARFVREGKAGAAIRHEHVVEVFDVGTENGVAFLAMEFLEGEPLAARFGRGRVPVNELLSMLLPVLDAIAMAHDKQIVHRDIKPDNIYLSRTSRGAVRPVVLDFGISKVLGDGASMQLTDTSAFIGTPFYVSPEQARGARHVSVRSDQYALGVVLYEGLCGSNPFAGCASLFELVSKVQSAEYPKPHTMAELPDGLEAVVLRAMHVDPDRRYASVRELSAALMPFADATTQSGFDTVRDFTPASAVDAPRDQATQVHAHAATVPSINDAPSTTLSGAVGDIGIPLSTTGSLVRGKGKWLVVGALVSVAGLVALAMRPEKPAFDTSATVATGPLYQPDLGLSVIAQYRAGRTHTTSAESWKSAGEDFGNKSAQGGAPERWRAAELFCHAQAQLHDGDVDDAIQNLAKSVDLDPRWAPPHAALSGAYSRRGEHESALEAARKAQQLEPTWPWAVAVGALSLGYAGKPDEAISEFRRALEMAPRDAELLSLLALQYHHEHNDSEARRYAEEALAADDDAVPAHVLLAELALEAGDAPTALMHASRAVAVSPTSVSGRLARADALQLSGMGPLAMDEYRKALEHASRNTNHGAPAGRIDSVQAALDKQTTPSLATTAARVVAEPPKITGRSRPPSRSQPTAPARSQPASRRPGDRSHPSGSLDDF